MTHFTFDELIRSNKATNLGINNRPDKPTTDHLIEMVDNLLDPARESYGRPLIVTSGYRSEELNKVVGGVKNSAHLIGYAVDLVSHYSTVEELFEWFKDYLINNNIKFDQLILEKSRTTQWVHLGYKNINNEQRCQIKELNV